MNIPDCYDPVYQEERRQASSICDCCGAVIYPGGKCYTLYVGKDALIVCAECASYMMDNPCIVEDVSYVN